MNRKNNFTIFIFLLICALLLSCNSDESGSVTKKSSTNFDIESEFNTHLSPEFNKKYLYEIVNEINTEQEVNGENISNESRSNMVISYLFTKDSSGSLNTHMIYEKFKLHVKAMGQEKDIDAENAEDSFEPVIKIFGAFKNAAIGYVADSSGKVKAISGLKKLSDDMYKFAGGDPDAIQLLKTSISQYTESKNMQAQFENIFSMLPDTVLKKGYSWVVMEPVASDIDALIGTKYTVKSISGNFITVSIASDIDLMNKHISLNGTQVTANLEGGRSGEIQIEKETGLVLYSDSILKLSGDLVVIGKIIPFKMRIKSKTSKLALENNDK